MGSRAFVKAYTPKAISSGGARSLLGSMKSGANTDLQERKFKASLEQNRYKTEISKNKNLMDQAIRIHNKKLDMISRENKRRGDFGESPLPMPTFRDTLREDFGIGNQPQPAGNMGGMGGASAVLNPQNQMIDKSAGLMNTFRNKARNQIPMANRGPMAQRKPDRAVLDQLVNSIPMPKNIVHPNLPQIDELISALDDYDSPKDAIQELMQLDDQLLEQGLDLASYGDDDTEQFYDAFRNKFGDAALQALQEDIGAKRGAGV